MEIIISRIAGLLVLLRIIHLGRNPVNGGRPPSDKRFKNNTARIFVEFNWMSWANLSNFIKLSVAVTGQSRILYNMKNI